MRRHAFTLVELLTAWYGAWSTRLFVMNP